MLSLPVTLEVPHADNEQQFLLQAIEAAAKTFRILNTKSSDDLEEVSSTITAQRYHGLHQAALGTDARAVTPA